MPTEEITLRQSRSWRAETGSALVVVLWLSALLAAMAMGFSTSMRTESQAALNMVENIRARALADAAIQRGIHDLLNATPEKSPLVDGTAEKFSFGGGELSVAIQSERGKVDLNKAPEVILKGVWSCPAYVPVFRFIYAAFRSNAKGLLLPSDEWRRREL